MLLQGFQQSRGKTEISRHKLRIVLRPVHTGQVEHKIRLRAIFLQERRIRLDIILINLIHAQLRAGTVLSIPDIFQGRNQILAYKASCASY